MRTRDPWDISIGDDEFWGGIYPAPYVTDSWVSIIELNNRDGSPSYEASKDVVRLRRLRLFRDAQINILRGDYADMELESYSSPAASIRWRQLRAAYNTTLGV